MPHTLLFFVLLLTSSNVNEVKKIDKLLTDWHHAASVSDAKTYFGYLADDAIFLGTDAKERWTKSEFEKWAAPWFKKKSAWNIYATNHSTGLTTGRNIYLSEDKLYAWFDEELVAGFGPARGSGILIKTKDGWKIKHYNLSMTIPNEIVNDIKPLVEKQLKSERDK